MAAPSPYLLYCTELIIVKIKQFIAYHYMPGGMVQDWEHRREEDRLLIERLLIIIRNILHVPPNTAQELVCLLPVLSSSLLVLSLYRKFCPNLEELWKRKLVEQKLEVKAWFSVNLCAL